MDERIRSALEHGQTIDITTTGRKSGLPRRIELSFENLGGRLYLCGEPGPRDWLANLQANPKFMFHLKESVKADLPVRARVILDQAERRDIFSKLIQMSESDADLEALVEGRPLVEVTIEAD